VKREYTALFSFCGLGAGALGFIRASARILGTDVRFRSVGGIDIDPDACRDFERLTKSPALCADISKITPEQLRAFAGETAPDVAFGSAPCKGSSGLVSDAKAAEKKYQDLNKLALDWTRTMLAAWATPPRMVLYENVPGIKRRAADMLRELRKILRAAGYVLHEGTHDCGEIGGLGQHRKRWLLVARRPESVPTLLYQPIKKRVRGVGEVIGELPLPGDPAAGPMHRLPRVAWLTWVRLALIPAGGDWRDLPAAVALPCAGKDKAQHNNKFKVHGWDSPTGTVIGATRPGSGAASVADPRVSSAAFANSYRVVRWDAATGTVTGACTPSNGAGVVADPRLHDPARHSREHNDHVYGVVRWNAPAHTVAGTSSNGNGPYAVADPRLPKGFNGVYGVNGWTTPIGTVTGEAASSTGAFTIADPRLGCAPRNGAYGIVAWTQPSGTVTAAGQHDNDEASVADPRIPADWRKPPGDPVPIIVALDGTWHRPMTTLELALLQGLPATLDGEPLVLTAKSDALRREHIGNAVPVGTAEAIARQMLLTLANADAGTFVLSGDGGGVWVDRQVEAFDA
jgi:site-specific DNA-cytosine methylase